MQNIVERDRVYASYFWNNAYFIYIQVVTQTHSHVSVFHYKENKSYQCQT